MDGTDLEKSARQASSTFMPPAARGPWLGNQEEVEPDRRRRWRELIGCRSFLMMENGSFEGKARLAQPAAALGDVDLLRAMQSSDLLRCLHTTPESPLSERDEKGGTAEHTRELGRCHRGALGIRLRV